MVTAYLKSRDIPLLLGFLPLLLFPVIFFLYHLPWEPLLYGLLLYTCAALALISWDIIRFLETHRKLRQAANSVVDSLSALPEPRDQIAQDYQHLLNLLSEEKRRLVSDGDIRLSDINEYYTLWAHQIKTPIAAMDLVLQTARDGLDVQGSAELAEQLFRISQYVEMVLQFIRTQGTARDYVFTPSDLNGIIRPVLRKFARSFIRRHITLVYPPLEATVLTDAKWLGFVLEQLLSNAIKYVSPGGRITIAMSSPGILSVADTGMGIDPADLPRVFERGFTGYNGRENKKSTGIGLYLCKRIMDQLGHKIRIDSTPGEGTVVTLDLNKQQIFLE